MRLLPFTLSIICISASTAALAVDNDERNHGGIEAFDTDGDGAINIDEFSVRQAEQLARLDSDANGVLTLDEYLNSRPPGMPRHPRGTRDEDSDRSRGDREAPSEEQIAEMRARMTERASTRFMEIDADGDEMISLVEFQEANFLAADTDNNGLITADELRKPKRRQSGGSQRRHRDEQSTEEVQL